MAAAAVGVRRATAEDLAALDRIERDAFTCDRLAPRQFRYHLRRSANRLLVAERNGAVVGYALLLIRRRTARLYSVAVTRRERGHGIGRTLCEAAAAVAEAAGVAALRLEVGASNRAARALYARLGYRPLQRLPGYYADGSDGIRLVKPLTPHAPNLRRQRTGSAG